MRTSVRWLNDYLDRPVTPDEAADAFTRVGFPVEHRESTDDGDVVLEVELTSNRGDCLSHLNLARELAAMTGRTVKEPSFARIPDGAGPVPVANLDHEACPLYTARVIRGVTVRPSPEWMQQRLRAIGQVPRNILVDATNFVLFEYGQPTHAFDLGRLGGPAIQVRPAKDGESLLPIGEGAKPLALRAGDLVIADASVPAAIAGVKGGAPSAVTERTTDVLIEAATFAQKSVRSSSRGLKVASDSSYRFERGVAAADVDEAADRLVALILEH
ncbi:MAG: phenylalanine--tRNA ligase beta subunit-related protein, partial [Phycisphaerales bacterium]